MKALVLSGALVCLGSLVACSVPDVVFTPGDAGADDADADPGDDANVNMEASPGTSPGQDGLAPMSVEASTPPMPTPTGCPMHPPMGAQGCCGTTPCVGPGCPMQCPSCAACAGQVCCTSKAQGSDDQKHMSGMVSCAPDPAGCGGGS